MSQRWNIDKSKPYAVRFVHAFDDQDVIDATVVGKRFYRMRSFLRDMGYVVASVSEVTSAGSEVEA